MEMPDAEWEDFPLDCEDEMTEQESEQKDKHMPLMCVPQTGTRRLRFK